MRSGVEEEKVGVGLKRRGERRREEERRKTKEVMRGKRREEGKVDKMMA